MKKFAMLIFIFVIINSLYSVQTRIDSLESELNRAPEKEKLQILEELVNQDTISPQKKVKYANSGLDIAKRLNLQNKIARFQKLLGSSYFDKGLYDESLNHSFEALRLFEQLNDNEQYAKTAQNIAGVLRELTRFDEALKYYDEAYHIMECLGRKDLMAKISQNIATIYVYKDKDYNKALEYFQNTLSLLKEIGPEPDIYYLISNIGYTHILIEEYAQAMKYFEEALPLAEAMKDDKITALILRNMGVSYKGMKDYPRSKEYLEKCIQFCKNDFPVFKMSCYNELSKIYQEQNDYQKAYEYSMKKIALKDSLFTLDSEEKIAEIKTKYETEKKEQQIEILKKENQIQSMTRNYFIGGFVFIFIISLFLYNRYRERTKANIILSNANKTISNQNEQLQLISRILRHDIANNLYSIERCLQSFFKSKEENCLQEVPAKINKSTDIIQRFSKISYLINEVNYTFPLDVRETIEKLLPSYENVEIEVNGKGEVLADDLLESVLDNIISNAIKHGKTERINIEIKPENEWLQISIADFGIGIPELIRDKIFEESFVYGESGNTGLGLFIVKKAVENYGGSVSVESNEPSGTVFVIRLKKA